MIERLQSPGGEIEVEHIPRIGGRLHRVRVRGTDVLRTPDDPERHRAEPFFWGAFVMVPWCNRLPGGAIDFGDVHARVPANLDGHAIHGEAYAAPWAEAVDGTLRYEGGGTEGRYPWRYAATSRLAVDDERVTLTLTVTNVDAAPMPAGIGLHPWFDAALGFRFSVPATEVYPSVDKVAVGDPEPVPAGIDPRPLRPPVWEVDRVFTNLAATTARLEWPDAGLAIDLDWSATADHVVIAAFEDFGAVAIEPQTQASDAIGRRARGEPGGASILPPGGSLAVTYELKVA